MSIDRIIVGYDGYRQSRGALAWATRQAAATGAVVHVVTAWTPNGDRPPAVAAVAARLREHQAAAIRASVDHLRGYGRPVITASVVMADPATALAAAAADADVVVIGSGTHIAGQLNTRLKRWSRSHGGPCPVRVVRTLSTKDIKLEIRSLAPIPQLASR